MSNIRERLIVLEDFCSESLDDFTPQEFEITRWFIAVLKLWALIHLFLTFIIHSFTWSPVCNWLWHAHAHAHTFYIIFAPNTLIKSVWVILIIHMHSSLSSLSLSLFLALSVFLNESVEWRSICLHQTVRMNVIIVSFPVWSICVISSHSHGWWHHRLSVSCKDYRRSL